MKPAVGAGVGGRKTVTHSSPSLPIFCRISPFVSVAMKTIDQTPLRGNSISAAFWNDLPPLPDSTVSNSCFSAL